MDESVVKPWSEFFQDRLTSPLISSILLSWAFWNAKLILIVCTSAGWGALEANIDTYFEGAFIFRFDDAGVNYFFGFLSRSIFYPVVSAYFYLYALLPFVDKVYEDSLTRKNKLKKSVIVARGDEPLDQKGAKLLRQELNRLQVELELLEQKSKEDQDGYRTSMAERQKVLDKERGRAYELDGTLQAANQRLEGFQLAIDYAVLNLQRVLDEADQQHRNEMIRDLRATLKKADFDRIKLEPEPEPGS